MATVVSNLPRFAVALLLLAMAASAANVNIGRVKHFLGNGTYNGSRDGTGTGPNGALLWRPNGCTFDAAGNLYIADTINVVVRKVAPGSATTTTWLGQSLQVGDVASNGTAARLGAPYSLRFTPDGTLAYLADYANHKVYRVTPATAGLQNWVGTLLGLPGDTDGTGTAAELRGPADLAIVPTSLDMYVTENLGNRVRKVTHAGVVTHFAGSTSAAPGSTDAAGALARFTKPHGIVVVTVGTVRLFVADTANAIIREVSTGAVVTTAAGNRTTGNVDGTGSAARFIEPWGLALDKTATYLYIADHGNNAIRRMSLANYAVDTVVNALHDAGWTSAADSTNARISAPNALCFLDGAGVSRLYITGDHSVSYVSARRTRTLTLTLPDPTANRTTTGALTTLPGGSTTAPNRSTTAINGSTTTRVPTTLGFTTFPGGFTLPPNVTLPLNFTNGTRDISGASGPKTLLPVVAAVVVALVALAAAA